MTATSDNRPTFLIAGMQKAGTTTLHYLLSQYPEIFLPEKKELHLFSTGPVNDRRFKRYLIHFAPARHDQARGEASPIYAYLPGALEQAAHWLGVQTKIILILRNPIARAYSHYWYEIQQGCEYRSFRDAIDRFLHEKRDLFYYRHHSYVERGLYSAQIQRAEYLFGKKNVFVVRLEDLKANPLALSNKVADFIVPGCQKKMVSPPASATRLRSLKSYGPT